jgi:hypothetical protein
MKMEQTHCSETSAIKRLTPENNTKDYTQHSEHGKSLKSRIVDFVGPEVEEELNVSWISFGTAFTSYVTRFVVTCLPRHHPQSSCHHLAIDVLLKFVCKIVRKTNSLQMPNLNNMQQVLDRKLHLYQMWNDNALSGAAI